MINRRISTEQASYFSDSVIRNAGGQLIPVYHGTTADIVEFDPDFTGHGNDQYGSGYYFSDSKEIAQGYGSGHIVEAYLNITHPISVDGTENANLRYFQVSCGDAAAILKFHPNIYKQPDDGDYMNPMCDYLPEFYDREEWSKDDLNEMIDSLAAQYFNDTNLLLLDVFFKDFPTEFRTALREVLGFDGVEIHFAECTNFVAWFPDQIKRVTNMTPTNSALIDG